MAPMQHQKLVAISVGTHTWTPTDEKVDRIIELLRKHKITHLDTARVYGAGGSETAIGDRQLTKEFTVDTKANTALFPGTGRFVAKDAADSWKALQTDKVRVYFLHGPDETVPFGEQVEAIQKLYLDGRFEKFGISNFNREQTLEVYNYAKERGYILPSVYQAGYNLAARLNETELFPTLRELGFALQAYSPMAMGFLAKTPEYIEQGLGSWNPNEPTGQQLRGMFYRPEYLKLLEGFGRLSEESGVTRVGLGYRWVRYHSALRGDLGDEMIIGVASAEQVEESLEVLQQGPLEDWIVKRIDVLSDIVKGIAKLDHVDTARKVYAGDAWGSVDGARG